MKKVHKMIQKNLEKIMHIFADAQKMIQKEEHFNVNYVKKVIYLILLYIHIVNKNIIQIILQEEEEGDLKKI